MLGPKFLAAFFNKEASARDHFSALIHRYENAKTTASEKPLVAWVTYNAPSSWGVEHYVVSLATYKMHYIEAAGGRSVDAATILAVGEDKVTKDAAGTVSFIKRCCVYAWQR